MMMILQNYEILNLLAILLFFLCIILKMRFSIFPIVLVLFKYFPIVFIAAFNKEREILTE